MPAQNQAVRME